MTTRLFFIPNPEDYETGSFNTRKIPERLFLSFHKKYSKKEDIAEFYRFPDLHPNKEGSLLIAKELKNIYSKKCFSQDHKTRKL